MLSCLIWSDCTVVCITLSNHYRDMSACSHTRLSDLFLYRSFFVPVCLFIPATTNHSTCLTSSLSLSLYASHLVISRSHRV